MNIIDIKEEYEEKVLNIWERYKKLSFLNEVSHRYRKSPLLPKSVNKNTLLFIGTNPSFRKEAEMPKNEIEFYEIDKNKKQIQYYEKFKDIARFCNAGNNWSHLDLLFIRETKQGEIRKLTYTDQGIDFFKEQLDISFDIIEKAIPKILIVSNALAAEFFGKKKAKHSKLVKIWKGFDLDFNKNFNNKIGTYEILINGKHIPIIFSGMLSGQRALDIGSFERLKWQIKYILKTMKL